MGTGVIAVTLAIRGNGWKLAYFPHSARCAPLGSCLFAWTPGNLAA